jgi:uncharacterized membrane protein
VTLDEVLSVVSDLEGQALTATEDGWLREDLADTREKVRAAIESHARDQRRAALEEAAKKCREVSRRLEANGDTGPAWGAIECEKAVDALAGEEAAR